MQQVRKQECSSTLKGIARRQSGQKSPSALSCPWPYSFSSLSSAARSSHASLCSLRWICWQSTLQYLTRKQAVHSLSLMVSLPPLPQLAQTWAAFAAATVMQLIPEVHLIADHPWRVGGGPSGDTPVPENNKSGLIWLAEPLGIFEFSITFLFLGLQGHRDPYSQGGCTRDIPDTIVDVHDRVCGKRSYEEETPAHCCYLIVPRLARRPIGGQANQPTSDLLGKTMTSSRAHAFPPKNSTDSHIDKLIRSPPPTTSH